MPREYSNRPTGPRTPEPLSFGAADINLQTPQFRAQTNVDPGVNVFGQLQEIIGAAVGVAKQRIDMDTEAFKNKVSYKNAVAAEKERTDREKVIAFTAEAASQRETAAATNDLTGLTEQQNRLLEVIKNPEASNEEKIAASQQLQAIGVDIGRVTADKEEADRSSIKLVVDAARAAGDVAQIEAIENDILLAAKNGTITKIQTDILPYVTTAKEQVERGIEQTIDQEKLRASQAAAEAMASPLYDVTSRLSSDREFLITIAGSGTGIEGPLFDEIRDSLIYDYPDVARVFYNGSDEEIKTVSVEIAKAAKYLTKKAIDARTEKNLRDGYDNAVNEAAATASTTGIVTALQAIENDPRIQGTTATNEAVRRASASYVNAGTSSVDRLARAQAVAENPITAAAGARLYADEVKKIRNDIELGRDGTRDLNEVEYGWTKQYPTPELFLERVLSSFGYKKIEDTPNQVRGAVLDLMGQYERDYNARTTAVERQNRASLMKDPKNRGKVEANEVWDGSIISKYTEDLDALNQVSASDLGYMVREVSFGYKNNSVPDKLLAFMKVNRADPRTFRLQQAFWESQGGGENTRLANEVADDTDLFESRMIGIAMELGRSQGLTPEQSITNTQVMVQNLRARTSRGTEDMSDTQKAAVTKADSEIRVNTAETIAAAYGVKLQGSYGVDNVDVTAGQLAANLETMDRARFNMYIDAASAYPGGFDAVPNMALKMMQNDGYDLVVDDKGLNLVYVLGKDAAGNEIRVLPPYTAMKSPEWKAYLMSHKEQLVARINAMEQRGLVISPDAIESVTPRFNDFDVGVYNGVGLNVKLRNVDRPVLVPASEVRVSLQGFEAFKQSYKAPEKKTNYLLPAVSLGR